MIHARKFAFAILLASTSATVIACSSSNGGEDVQASNDELASRRVMSRRQVTDTIKSVSAKRGITNSLLVAGIANHETNLAHCVADYYVTQCQQTPGTPRSTSCRGGSVTVGNADGTCDQGGLGLFQIDRGTQEDTVRAYGARVVELDGNVDIGIDYILDAMWQCDLTPNFGSERNAAYQKAAQWMNGVRRGSNDYATYFTCIARHYNGCVGSCNTAARAAQYRGDTDSLVSEFGDAYWAAPGGVRCEANGLYCGSSPDLPKGQFDAMTLYRCNASGEGLTAQERCKTACYQAPSGVPDRCINLNVQ
jgi:hypothetical protein